MAGSSNGEGTMRFAAIYLSITALLAATSARAATTMPREELSPRRASPLVVAPAAEQDQLLETLSLLERSLELSAATFNELTRDAVDAELALNKASRIFVEGPLRDAVAEYQERTPVPEPEERVSIDEHLLSLAEHTASEFDRLSWFAAMLDTLAELDAGALSKRNVRRALTRIENRLGRLRDSYPLLNERFDSLAANTSRQVKRLGADRLARTLRLQHAVRGLDWQITRLSTRLRRLREKR